MLQTPNAASVALIDRDQVLLIRRARKPWLGRWSLPGGRLEPGETAEQAATRELFEEVGLSVSELRPVRQMVFVEAGQFVLQVFATTRFEGRVTPNEEASACRWVRPGQLAELETTPGLEAVVQEAFAILDRS